MTDTKCFVPGWMVWDTYWSPGRVGRPTAGGVGTTVSFFIPHYVRIAKNGSNILKYIPGTYSTVLFYGGP